MIDKQALSVVKPEEAREPAPAPMRPSKVGKAAGQWKQWAVLLLIIIAGTLAAAYRAFGYDRDYWQYVDYFAFVRYGGCSAAFEQRFEPAFGLAVCGLVALDPRAAIVNDEVLLGLAAFVALSLKLTLLKRMGPGFWMGIAVYALRFYPLHEMTQIRAAIGLGFTYWAIFLWFENERVRSLATLIVAVLFHYSCIFTGLFAGATQFAAGRLRALAIGVILAVIVRFTLADAIAQGTKYFLNLQNAQSAGFGTDANVLSLGVLLDLAILSMWAFTWSDLDALQKRFLALFGIAFVVLWTSAEYPLLAWRFCETFQPAICFVVARSRTRSAKLLSFATVTAYAATYPYFYATRDFFF